jgi:hypothetical protein
MLRSISRGTITVALTLTWLAAAWVAFDVLFAEPDVLVCEDIAILCAVLAPIIYLIGWGLRWLSFRFGGERQVRRA